MTTHSTNALVVQHLEARTHDAQIRKELVEHHGFDPHAAFGFVEDTKAANPEITRRREQHLNTIARETERAQRRVLVRQDLMRRLRTVLVGVAVFGVGLLTLQAAAAGLLPQGWYLLSILPIISGPFIVGGGIID